MVNYLSKLWQIFTGPKKFFKTVEKESKYGSILLFYVVAILAAFIIGVIADIPSQINISQGIGTILLGDLFIILFVGAILFATPFVSAGLVHLGLFIFRDKKGGRKGFFNTFKPVTYGSMVGFWYLIIGSLLSTILMYLIPYPNGTIDATNSMQMLWHPATLVVIVASLAAYIHSLVVQTIGVAKFQNVSQTRSFWTVFVIPFIVGILLIIGFLILLSTAYYLLAQSGQTS